MSKVKKITTQLSYTASFSSGILTVTTTTNHNLVTGDVVDIFGKASPFHLPQASVTVTSNTTFNVTTAQPYDEFTAGTITVSFFRATQTGRQVFTAPHSNGAPSVVQSYVSGIGGIASSYTLDTSLDGIHWNTGATITHGTSDGDTQTITVAANWAYLAVNIISVGAGMALTVMYSA